MDSLTNIAFPEIWPEDIPRDTLLAFDFETIPGTLYSPDLLSFAWKNKDGSIGSVVYDLKKITGKFWNRIYKVLDESKSLIGHNVLYELKVLYFNGYKIDNILHKMEDSMVLSYVVDTEMGHGLGDLATLVGKDKMKWKEAHAAGGNVYIEYNRDDSIMSLLLFDHFMPIAASMNVVESYEFEKRMISPTIHMFCNGIYMDKALLKQLDEQFKRDMDEYRRVMISRAGKVLNLKSSMQLRKLFYDDWGLEVNQDYLTKGGKSGNKQPGTSTDAVKDLLTRQGLSPEQQDFFQNLLLFKKVEKLSNTYTSDGFVNMILPNGRLNMNMNPWGTATGRGSSSEPNLQAIPKQGVGFILRQAFSASPGGRFVSVDWGQAEYRLFAHFTGDPYFLDAYEQDPKTDLHQIVAEMLGVSRSAAKNMNFMLLYGGSAKKLAKMMSSADRHVTVEEAAQLFARYFEMFPSIKAFTERTVSYANLHGYVRTMSGKIRNLTPYLKFNDGGFQRRAINTVVQGGVADMMKLAMIKLDSELPSDIKMVMQVHDELNFDILEAKRADEAARYIQEVMESVHALTVPFIADPTMGANWYECKLED